MPKTIPVPFVFSTLILLVTFAVTPAWAQERKAPRVIVPIEGLVLKNPGKGYGRVPIHEDPLEAELINGRWKVPKAGDLVKNALGKLVPWEKVTLNKDGQIQHASLVGGYLYVPIELKEPGIWLLEAGKNGDRHRPRLDITNISDGRAGARPHFFTNSERSFF